MKTPREILFSRHQTAAPKLDAIRREVVEELNNKETKEQSLSAFFVASLLRCPNKFWRELVLPARRIWAGFAVSWLIIVAVNFADADRTNYSEAKLKSPPVNMMLALQQQEKLLAEFNDPEITDADKPKHAAPKPRS